MDTREDRERERVSFMKISSLQQIGDFYMHIRKIGHSLSEARVHRA